MDIIDIKYTPEQIIQKRLQVADMFLHGSSPGSKDIKKISSSDLSLLMTAYDEVFFHNWFQKYFKGQLRFSLSRRMTRNAGKTICSREKGVSSPEQLNIEVRIGIDFLTNYGFIAGANLVGGIATSSSLEALQIIFEHELIHVIEFVKFQSSSCKRNRFKTMAFNLFGHTESCHRLATNQQIASQKMGLVIGSMVSFPFEGKTLEGRLYRINKRATVMVRDKKGHFADRQGLRYSKYYVPLKALKEL